MEQEKINILAVDDRSANLLALEALLDEHNYNIIKAFSGNDALGLVLEHDCALVLLDVQMPDMDGFETAELMRSNITTRHIPIIFVTAISKDIHHVFKGYQAGAVDYLAKPIEPHILKSKVAVFVELYQQRRSLERTSAELKLANQKIIAQQQTIIGEERFKVLLQLTAAVAKKLNQPLIDLLENIFMLKRHHHDPLKLKNYLKTIEKNGLQISNIIKNLKTIRHYEGADREAAPAIDITLDGSLSVLAVMHTSDLTDLIKTNISQTCKLQIITELDAAMQALKGDAYNLIFLQIDAGLTESLEFFHRLALEKIKIPVVIITNKDDEIIISRMIQAGAYDYLISDDINKKSLTRVINTTLEKSHLKNQLEKTMVKMAGMAVKDDLTGLYSRSYLMKIIEKKTLNANTDKKDLSFAILDLDHFNDINETLGNLAGDMALAQIGIMLKENFREQVLLGRWTGAAFAVIMPDVDLDKAFVALEKFRKVLADHIFKFNSAQFYVRVSIGISSLKQGDSGSQLIDQAMESLLSG